jgi:hypothetical protein
MIGFYSTGFHGWEAAQMWPHNSYEYRGDPNNGHSNTGTLRFPDFFSSGYWMAIHHPFSSPVFKFCASLDHFIKKIILYKTVMSRRPFENQTDFLQARTIYTNISFV